MTQTTTPSTESTPVALVSGSNRGIGFQVANDLAANGFIVLVGSRDLDNGTEAAAEIGASAQAIGLDVADATSVAAAAERIRCDFGRLDLLVNNAGVSFIGSPDTPLRERAESGLFTNVSLETMRSIYEINVFGVVALTQALLPLLRTTEGSRIVNVGSGGGSLTANSDPDNPHRQMFGVYPASKAALHAVSLGFATALESEGIPVNTVDPGLTSTGLNGFQGIRTVEEGAARIVEVALQGRSGPTGTFTSNEGTVPW
jgi:NAD(P)-dependent dehydrogenase (short-subunit alcohol dehydrogenase family)